MLQQWLKGRRQKATERATERAKAIEAPRRVHDFTDARRGWGHDIGYRPAPGQRLEGHGWARGIKAGDYLVLTNRANGRSTRYMVDDIRYCSNPTDMFFFSATFAPRTDWLACATCGAETGDKAAADAHRCNILGDT